MKPGKHQRSKQTKNRISKSLSLSVKLFSTAVLIVGTEISKQIL